MLSGSYRRDWEGSDWQQFALRLVSIKHGSHNVQAVPDRVDGDAGLEFFTTDGCLYQCFAPQETVDVAKASRAMKDKATQDIAKLSKYEAKIQGIVGNLKFGRWILLCPFLDDKDVVRHIQKKISDENCNDLSFSDGNFVGMAKCLSDFEDEYGRLRSNGRGLPLRLRLADENDSKFIEVEGELYDKIKGKLKRAYPGKGEKFWKARAKQFILASITKQNVVEDLKRDYPEEWEMWFSAIAMEENRLGFIGEQEGSAQELLRKELSGLNGKLKEVLPNLETNFRTALANGQIGTWLIDCPLDFEE
ncbi:hypothetical protein LCM28_05550 [Salipiger pacificus]|nr:hypothetical protein [Alloyangia pacifica]